MAGKTHLLTLKEDLSHFLHRTMGVRPRYLLLTRKFERQLFLEGSFKKSENIDEVITLPVLYEDIEIEINVLVVEYVILDKSVRKDDWFQFV